MDYDGFRQMVLGANLKPMKKDAATEIFQVHYKEGNINSIASYNKIVQDEDDGGLGFDEEIVRRTLEMSNSDKLEAPSSPEVFEKFLCKKLLDPMQRYTYMRLIPFDHIKSAFKTQFDADVLLVIIDTFNKQVLDNETFNNATE